MTRVRSLVSALVLVASIGCSGRKPVQSEDAKSQGPGKPFVAAGEQPALAPVQRAVELLPPDTQLLFEGRSLARAAEVLDRDKIEKEAPELYARVAQTLEKVFGVDPMVPANLPAIGVDPDGAVGIALLDARREAFAVWVRVSDPGKFREVALAAAGRAGRQLTPLSLGGAEILQDHNGRAALVLREPFAVFVISRPAREGQADVDWARAIGTMDPSQSLANAPSFRKATAGWVDTDAIVYGDLAGLASAILDEDDAAFASNNWAEEAVAQARRNGASPEEIARLEAQAKQVADENKRWEARRKAERELARFIFADLSSLAARIDVKRRGPVIEGRVQQGPAAFPRSVVRNFDEAAPLTWALDGTPVVLAGGAFEVDAMVDFVDRVARADGESWKSVVEEIEKETGVDVNTEIRPQLTGVAGFAMTLDGDLAKAKPRTMSSLLGISAHAEVKDPAAVEAVLARALPKLDIDGRTFKKDRGGGWSVDVEDFRKVHVKVAGKHVVVSTDPGLAARLASGKEGTIAKRMRPAGAWAAASMKGQAFTWVQDFAAMAGFLSVSSRFEAPLQSGLDKPKSRTARRKLAELERLNEKIAAQQAIVDAAEMKKLLDAVDPFGATVLVAREEGDGLVVQGGQFIRAESLGDLVVVAAKAIMRGFEPTPERQKLGELVDRRFELEEELRQLQQADAPQPSKRR